MGSAFTEITVTFNDFFVNLKNMIVQGWLLYGWKFNDTTKMITMVFIK